MANKLGAFIKFLKRKRPYKQVSRDNINSYPHLLAPPPFLGEDKWFTPSCSVN